MTYRIIANTDGSMTLANEAGAPLKSHPRQDQG